MVSRADRSPGEFYQLDVEISVPSVNRISLANSGIIESRGGFPRQNDLAVAVAHGGTIDVRSLPADSVTASVEHGGNILTIAEARLSARVTQGGWITYWGDGQVKSSIDHGGAVVKGTAAEMNLPLRELR